MRRRIKLFQFWKPERKAAVFLNEQVDVRIHVTIFLCYKKNRKPLGTKTGMA